MRKSIVVVVVNLHTEGIIRAFSIVYLSSEVFTGLCSTLRNCFIGQFSEFFKFKLLPKRYKNLINLRKRKEFLSP